jgi:large subunit ribosomal protein L1
MAKLTKRAKVINEKVMHGKQYAIDEALALLQELSSVKFKESVDVSVNLGIDPRKSDQAVRGATVLPNGTGKTVRVAVFAQGANADAAKEAGADVVGFEDLAEEVKKGNLDFDVVIASPDAMRVVGALGQILGPRGLMPNPKVGTVTPDVATAVKNAKAGQVRYRAEGKPRGIAGGPEQGQAGQRQGRVYEEGVGFHDHGPWPAGRPGNAGIRDFLHYPSRRKGGGGKWIKEGHCLSRVWR